MIKKLWARLVRVTETTTTIPVRETTRLNQRLAELRTRELPVVGGD